MHNMPGTLKKSCRFTEPATLLKERNFSGLCLWAGGVLAGLSFGFDDVGYVDIPGAEHVVAVVLWTGQLP
jgi:hypothetical protein